MVDDSELESRAIEELLRETNRARLRTETMGPAGWLKCPLQRTNKRFLINTLRSTIMKNPTSGEMSTSQGHQEGECLSQFKESKRTNPTEHKDSGAREDKNNNNHNNFKGGCSYKYADKIHQKNWRDKDLEKGRIRSLEPSSCEAYSSSRGHSLSRDCNQSRHNASSFSKNSSLSRHSHCRQRSRTRSRSPLTEMPRGSKHK